MPPLNAGAGRDKGRRTEPSEPSPAQPRTRSEERPRLSAKARALADELEGRASNGRRDDENGTVD